LCLTQTSFDKKSYLGYLKTYMAKVLEKLDKADKEVFKNGAQNFVKEFVMKNFNEIQFFLPESQSDEGIIVLAMWVGEEVTFYYWKHGLCAEKV